MTPDTENACPLSPCLLGLLQLCVDLKSTKDRKLAEHLCLSPETVKTEFKRIGQVLDTHDRFEAIMMAWENGWIRLSPPPCSISYERLIICLLKIVPNWGIALTIRFLL